MSTELDHLRRFRADDGAPDPDARAAARAALVERIEAAGVAAAAAPRRRRPRRLLAGLGGLALAGAAAVAIALATGLGEGGVQPQPATAAEVLRAAATHVQAAPYAPVGPGQWWYVRTEGDNGVGGGGGEHPVYSLTVSSVHEEWTAEGRWGRTRTTFGDDPRFPSELARRAWEANGRPHVGEVMDNRVAPWRGSPRLGGTTAMSPAAVRRLPTDVDALYARVSAVANGQASEMWRLALGLLGQFMAPNPPELQAALYRVLARIPGARLGGETVDARGRRGVAIALDAHGRRMELVLDPASGELLEERTTLLRAVDGILLEDGRPAPGNRMPAGTTTRTTFLESGVVDSRRERP